MPGRPAGRCAWAMRTHHPHTVFAPLPPSGHIPPRGHAPRRSSAADLLAEDWIESATAVIMSLGGLIESAPGASITSPRLK
jgi:hypothetical protein